MVVSKELSLKDTLTALVNEFGTESVQAAADAMGHKVALLPAVPKDCTPVIAVDKLLQTVDQLDASVSDIIEKATGREKVYGDKVALLRQRRELETQIELKESEAFMQIRGEARSQYVMQGTEKIMLTNEESRKAYAKMAAADERRKLSEVEGELVQIEQKAFWAKDEYEAAVYAGNQVQAKAYVQAGLLNMLAGRR